jgi:hypothetical protein
MPNDPLEQARRWWMIAQLVFVVINIGTLMFIAFGTWWCV